MLFNSIEFALFLPIVFVVYWAIPRGRLRLQNLFLLGASYFFYGCWDWRFLSLIALSSLVDFSAGIGLSRTNDPTRRKLILACSIVVNLGFLGFFKYFNFFVESFSEAFAFFGKPIGTPGLQIVLPVGISFYTFQTMSYSIDLYRRKIEPARDVISYLAFVAFFPQLVAGPIERASNLLSQFSTKRRFDPGEAHEGMRQILWGLFKKVVIADNCAAYANIIFNDYGYYSGSTLVLGALFFTVQIYGDFSGYSDIAIGTARLFGFRLMQNFAFPYFSRSIAEFWARWHISLTTWFRDYVYIPLGGSRISKWITARNVAIVFLVSGFWHGANWTFIAWGALNALYFSATNFLGWGGKGETVAAQGRLFPSVKEIIQIGGTFFLVVLGWVIFRSPTISDAIRYIQLMFSPSIIGMPETTSLRMLAIIVISCGFFCLEWLRREKKFTLESFDTVLGMPFRWAFYAGIVYGIVWLGGDQQDFIYFQF